jgi:hypothetical protein
MVGHLEDAADIGGLPAVQKEVGFRGVRVAVTVAVEEAEGHQRVQKVARRAGMETQTGAERRKCLGTAGELREHADLDGAEERLRGPEGEACL